MNFLNPFRLALLLPLLPLLLAEAHAALVAKTKPNGANLRNTASEAGELLEELKPGQMVTLSDTPSNGYYRARSASGKTGYVSQKEIQVVGIYPGGSKAQRKTASIRPSTSTAEAKTPTESGFAWEPGFSYNSLIGLGLGGGIFYQFSRAKSSLLESGVELHSFLFNTTKPTETALSARYWLGGEEFRVGAEVFAGLTFFAASDFEGFDEFGSSLVAGPGIRFAYRPDPGVQIGLGARQNLSSVSKTYLVGTVSVEF